MKKKIFSRLILLLFLIVIAANTYSQVVHTITITDFAFTPNNLTVMVGDTVRWSYTSGSFAHNVKADDGSFTSGAPALPPWTYDHVFTSASNNPYYCEPHGGSGGSGMSGVVIVQNPVSVDDDDLVVDEFELLQNYPNPFNPSTNIEFRISDRGFVSLKVYNILGGEIATLVNEEKERGVYDITFDATGLSSGMYLYKLQAGNFVETRKMIMMK
jgi:plastocyanin